MESGGARAISRPPPSLSVTDQQIQFLHKRKDCDIIPNREAYACIHQLFPMLRKIEERQSAAMNGKLSGYNLNEKYAIVLNILLVTHCQIQFLPTTIRQFCGQKMHCHSGEFSELPKRHKKHKCWNQRSALKLTTCDL